MMHQSLKISRKLKCSREDNITKLHKTRVDRVENKVKHTTMDKIRFAKLVSVSTGSCEC